MVFSVADSVQEITAILIALNHDFAVMPAIQDMEANRRRALLRACRASHGDSPPAPAIRTLVYPQVSHVQDVA